MALYPRDIINKTTQECHDMLRIDAVSELVQQTLTCKIDTKYFAAFVRAGLELNICGFGISPEQALSESELLCGWSYNSTDDLEILPLSSEAFAWLADQSNDYNHEDCGCEQSAPDQPIDTVYKYYDEFDPENPEGEVRWGVVRRQVVGPKKDG